MKLEVREKNQLWNDKDTGVLEDLRESATRILTLIIVN